MSSERTSPYAGFKLTASVPGSLEGPCFSNSRTHFGDIGGPVRTRCTCSSEGRPADCTLSEIRGPLHLEGPQVLLVQGDVPEEGSWREKKMTGAELVILPSTDSHRPVGTDPAPSAVSLLTRREEGREEGGRLWGSLGRLTLPFQLASRHSWCPAPTRSLAPRRHGHVIYSTVL